MNTRRSPLVPCGSQRNHATFQGANGHNSAISWPILDLFGTNKHQRIPFCPIWFSIESRYLSGRKWPLLSHFLTDFGSFWYKWTPKDPLLSHIVLNGITQPLREKMAITQPFLDRFWIFLAQMNTQGFPLVTRGSQWNHATSQWENSRNSAISWLILDLFGTNEHPSIPFGPIWFSMK